MKPLDVRLLKIVVSSQNRKIETVDRKCKESQATQGMVHIKTPGKYSDTQLQKLRLKEASKT